MHDEHHQLPVKAAIEGAAACFRLLEIDDGSGMKHDQFVALLMSATDNRLVLCSPFEVLRTWYIFCFRVLFYIFLPHRKKFMCHSSAKC